jgi:hypothetical protein
MALKRAAVPQVKYESRMLGGAAPYVALKMRR